MEVLEVFGNMTNKEINKRRIYELFDGNILRAYQVVIKNGNLLLNPSKREFNIFLAISLSKIYTPRQISLMTNTSIHIARKKRYKFSKTFINCFNIFSDYYLFSIKCEKYTAIPINLNKRTVERMIIEILKQFWTNHQIQKATGFNIRRIQRIKKRLGND
jgi:hypothetical protein